MPISSVVGAQSIIKPGICTSSTRPASPFDGQVVYMTDVEQMAVWDGTDWVGLDPSRDRNVIINGAMQVAQRGTSTASITGNGYYTADRWQTALITLGTWTQSVEADAPTGSGFRKSLKMLCTTADASPAAGDIAIMNTRFEGQNLQQFLKGTASAKQFAVSFWVKSNVTGTYIAELLDLDNTRQVSASYTVAVSGTWEKKTIVFPADTTGAFDNDNAGSMYMQFYLASGSNRTSGTLQTTWASTVTANRAVGQTNLAAATSNYWQITGVQLEAGAVATPFEFEDFSTTLAKCQRYYWRANAANGAGVYYMFGFGQGDTTTNVEANVILPVPMRVAPTAIETTATASNYAVYAGTVISACTSLPLIGSSNSSPQLMGISFRSTGAITVGRAYQVIANFNNTAYLGFSAEL
jgi:hypothetical protein